MLLSEIDIAMHALWYVFVNKLFYLLHYWRHGVTWLSHRYHKYVIELAKKFGEWTACTQCTAQGKDFELILTVKMETRHPIGGPFSREILASVIITELWRPEVAGPGNFFSNFCFFGKVTPYGKIFSESLHGNTDPRCCVRMS